MSEPTLLLTGATGFVGGAVRAALVAQGWRVRCLTRDAAGARQRQPELDWAQGDVGELGSCAAALRGCRAALYLVHGIGEGADYHQHEVATAETFAGWRDCIRREFASPTSEICFGFRSLDMMIPVLVVHDVTVLPDGELALGGTDEYLEPTFDLRARYSDGRALLIILRGGQRIETVVSETRVHTALSGQRNIYLKIPNIVNEVESTRGAIVCMDC